MSKTKSFISSQRFLIIGVIASVVVILVSCWLLLYFNRNVLRQNVKEKALFYMGKVLEQHNNSLYEIRTTVTTQMNNFGKYYNDKDSSYVLLTKIMEKLPEALSASMVYDEDFFHDGKMYFPYISRNVSGDELVKVDMTDSTYIFKLMSTVESYEEYNIKDMFDFVSMYRNSFLSEPHAYNDTELLVSFMFPIINSITGQLDAFLIVDFPYEDWYDDMNAVNSFPNGEYFFVTPEDYSISGSGQSFKFVNNAAEMLSKKVEQDVRPMIAAAMPGELNDYETDNGKRFVCLSKLKESEFVFFYTCPISDLWAQVFHWFVKFVVTMIIAMLLIFAMIGLSFYHVFKAWKKEKSMEDDIQSASYIQQSMLPKDACCDKRIDCHAVLIPAKYVGGDLYYYFMRKEYLYFCLGDVSGKGIAASLFMARTISLYCDISQYAISPADIAESLNQELCCDNRQNMFVTAFFGIFNTKTGVLKFCNAGQEEPIYCSSGKEKPFCLNTSFNIPLGIDKDIRFVEGEMNLAPGSLFMVFSDGVNEAMNKSHEMYGEERVIDFLASQPISSSKSLNEALVEDIGKFAGKHEQSDDITIFTMRYIPLHKELVIRNDIKELEKIHDYMDEIQEVIQIPQGEMDIVKVAIDEAMTNVVRYAYPNPGHSVCLLAEIVDGQLAFTLSDNGVPFNPLEYEPSQPNAMNSTDPDDISIGGLGIPIIKESFDELEYHYENKTNLLTLKKTLNYGS